MELPELALRILDIYRQEVSSNNKIASGALLNTSIETEVRGEHYLVYLNLPTYWKYVEYGREPGKFPPIDKIKEWIRIKPLIPEARTRGKVPTTDQLAFLVSRSIANDGIKPTPILENTLNKSDEVLEEFVNTYLKGIDVEIKKLL